MKLNRIQLAGEPYVGWTPQVNSFYMLMDVTGKVYFPIPGSASMSYIYLRDTDLFLQLIQSTDVHLGSAPTDPTGIRIDYLTTSAPYSVQLTTATEEYLLTCLDSADTSISVTSDSAVIRVHSCHAEKARILQLKPICLYTFDYRYTGNQPSYYVDEVGYVRLECEGLPVYPSGWSCAADRAMLTPPGVSATTELVTLHDSTNYTIMLNFAADGDGSLLEVGSLHIGVVSGQLVITLDGIEYATGYTVVGASLSGCVSNCTVSPSHSVYCIVTPGSMTVLVDLATVFTYPIAVDTPPLPAIMQLAIPEVTSTRQYNGLAIFTQFTPVTSLICDPTVTDMFSLTPIKKAGTNCTMTRVTLGTLTSESQQGACAVEVYPETDSTYYIIVSNPTKVDKLIHCVALADTPVTTTLWLDTSDTVRVSTIIGSISSRIITIGEH